MTEEVSREGGSQMRVAIIGPVRPFRSGIAEHTTMLARALADHADVRVISFSRQYPALLFPGENDRDPSMVPLSHPTTNFLIDSLDPRTWRAAVRSLETFDPELVLIPWWTVLWMPCFWYLARSLRKPGRHVRLLCHNVVDHEYAKWKAWLSERLFAQVDSFAVQSREAADTLRAALPDARIVVHPIPLFTQFPDANGTLSRRAPLELLFFGIVRPYKGVDILIEALGLLDSTTVQLTVAGEFWEGRAQIDALVRDRGLEDRVEIVDRYVSDQEAAEFFQRCDVVVLPYRSATASGVIALAYRYLKPIIVTRVGGLPDVVVEGETGIVVTPSSPESLAVAIDSFTQDRARGMQEAIRALSSTMSWDGLARALIDADLPHGPS